MEEDLELQEMKVQTEILISLVQGQEMVPQLWELLQDQVSLLSTDLPIELEQQEQQGRQGLHTVQVVVPHTELQVIPMEFQAAVLALNQVVH